MDAIFRKDQTLNIDSVENHLKKEKPSECSDGDPCYNS